MMSEAELATTVGLGAEFKPRLVPEAMISFFVEVASRLKKDGP